MTSIVVIANPKGGVGKTTTTISFAAIAAKDGNKVLVIDLDTQGHSGFYSNINNNDTENYASAMFQNTPTPPSELAIPTKYGYDIIIAGREMLSAESWITNTPIGEQRLSMLFTNDVGLKKYDYVFIDTIGARSKLLTSSLLAADEVIIPFHPSELSFCELPDFLQFIDGLSDFRSKEPLYIRTFLYSSVKENTNSAKYIFEKVEEEFGDMLPINPIVIPDSTVIIESTVLREPVIIFDENAKVSKRYIAAYRHAFGIRETV